jgi:hypothetical protein
MREVDMERTRRNHTTQDDNKRNKLTQDDTNYTCRKVFIPRGDRRLEWHLKNGIAGEIQYIGYRLAHRIVSHSESS